jgi:hypothetical protein
MKKGDRVRIKKSSRFFPGRRGVYLRDLTIGKRFWRVIDLRDVGPTCFHDDELYQQEDTMNTLVQYAQKLFPNVGVREDGSFWIEHNGRSIYSVIHDCGRTFESWNYSRGWRGCHRGRNAESVKRSLRRIRSAYAGKGAQ